MKKQKRSNKCRRILSALTAAALSLMTLPVQVSAVSESIIPGDVNDDGEVTVIDIIVLQGYIHGHDNVQIYAPWNADIDGDGEVDVFDLALVKRIVLGNGTVIPIKPDDPEPTQPTEPPTVTEGKLYSQIGLVDPYANVVAFQGLLPDGWTVQMQSNWGLINPYPGQEIVQFVSPDGKASISIASPLIYEEGSDRGYGADLSNFITLAPYMNASNYIDYYVQNTYANAEAVGDLEITEEQQANINAFTEIFATNGINTAMQTSRYQITGYGAEGTVARRQFRLGDGYGEIGCAISEYQYSYTKIILNVTETWWQILPSFVYTAADKDAFDQYYADYEVIAANGYFTAALYSVQNYVAMQIYNTIMDYRTEQRIQELTGGYSTSGTEITNSDMETQERVFQAWDDYIKDENVYSLSDGSSLRVPTSVDTVAQNGDSVYFGTAGGVPIGYDILTAN